MLGSGLRLCLVGTLLLVTTVAGKTIWNQRDEILPWLASIQQHLGFGSGTGTTPVADAAPTRTRSFLPEFAVSRVSTVPAPPRTGQSVSGVAPARPAASLAPARVADTAHAAAARWTLALASPAAAPAVSRQKSMVSAPASPAGASAVPVPAAVAASPFVWQGGSLTANWTNGGNWVGNTAPAPGAGADIAFTSTPAKATASTVDTNYTINSLTFQEGTPAYTIGNANSASLIINGGGVTDASSASQQNLALPVVLGANQTWNVSNAASTLYMQGSLSGFDTLTKTGPGTLNLGGSGAYNSVSTLIVSAGTVQLDKDNGIPAVGRNLTIGNATNPGATGSAVAQLNNSDQTLDTNVTIYSDGVFDLTDNSTMINSLTMTGGAVRMGNSYGLADLTLMSITTNASATSALLTGTNLWDNLTSEDNEAGEQITANVARGTATYDLDVQAGFTYGTLVKTGAGVMRLAGTENDFFSVILNAGTLALASDTALGNIDGSTPSTFTLAGGTVTADGGDRTIANPVALTGSATIGASLDGTPRAISFTGTTTLTGSQTLTVNNTAATTLAAVDLNGANTLTVAGTGNTTISGVITDEGMGGGLTKTGTGTLTLSGENTYTGATVVNAGTLRAGANAPATAFGTNSAVTLANVSGATLDLNGQNEIIGSLAGGGSTGGNVTMGGGTLEVGGDNTSTAYAGVLSGDGGLVKTGTGMLTLTGGNTFSGNTNIETGTLAVNGSISPSNSQGSSNLTVYSGATLTGSGSLSVANVYVNGTLAPGSLVAPGRLVGSGDTSFSLSATSTLSILLGGTAAGSGYSNLTTGDAVTLDGGALKLTLSGGFVPVVGEQFTIINAAGIYETFAGGNGATFTDNAGDTYGITYTEFTTTLTVLAVPEPSACALLGLSGAGLLGLTLRRRSLRA